MKTLQDHINLMRSLKGREVFEVAQTLLDAGFRNIGGGCSRSAYRHGTAPFVVRVHKWDADVERRTHEMYVRAPRDLKKALVPILASGKFWSIQPYTKPCYEAQPTKDCPNACRVYSPDNHRYNHTHDRRGRMLLFDYAPHEGLIWPDGKRWSIGGRA